jgi:hypothetical protein
MLYLPIAIGRATTAFLLLLLHSTLTVFSSLPFTHDLGAPSAMLYLPIAIGSATTLFAVIR